MKTVSIIGLGWIGAPVARLLQDSFRVVGSTTTLEKREKLLAEGIDAVRFSLAPHPEGIGFNALFQSEIVIVTIPPRAESGNGIYYLEKLKYLKSQLNNSTVKRVIFISSTGIYPNDAGEYTEETPLSLTHTGHDTMFRAEQRLSQDRNYDLTILRFGGLLGDDRIPLKYFSGKDNVVGHTRVNFIHRRDAARMLAWIIEKELWNETFNGVAPQHPVRRQIYEKISRDLGIPLPASYQAASEGNDRLISSDKILATGFEFEFPDPLEFSYLP
jgi:nucleoside-diphosphate-sugar epimerase